MINNFLYSVLKRNKKKKNHYFLIQGVKTLKNIYNKRVSMCLSLNHLS